MFLFLWLIWVEGRNCAFNVPLPRVEGLASRGCSMHEDDHYLQNFVGVQKRKVLLAFICYHFHLLLALAGQTICIASEQRHDAFRYAFPSLYRVKYMPYNNWYCNFTLNWNILDFDRFNRCTHAEKIDVKEQENV